MRSIRGGAIAVSCRTFLQLLFRNHHLARLSITTRFNLVEIKSKLRYQQPELKLSQLLIQHIIHR